MHFVVFKATSCLPRELLLEKHLFETNSGVTELPLLLQHEQCREGEESSVLTELCM